MSTMAEVIERFLSANYPCACEGDCPGEHAEAEELADELTKAGFGELHGRRFALGARAAELEAAAEQYGPAQLTGLFFGRDGYTKAWLSARAAAIRAGEA